MPTEAFHAVRATLPWDRLQEGAISLQSALGPRWKSHPSVLVALPQTCLCGLLDLSNTVVAVNPARRLLVDCVACRASTTVESASISTGDQRHSEVGRHPGDVRLRQIADTQDSVRRSMKHRPTRRPPARSTVVAKHRSAVARRCAPARAGKDFFMDFGSTTPPRIRLTAAALPYRQWPSPSWLSGSRR